MLGGGHNDLFIEVFLRPLQHFKIKLHQGIQHILNIQITLNQRMYPVSNGHLITNQLLIPLLNKEYFKESNHFYLLTVLYPSYLVF